MMKRQLDLLQYRDRNVIYGITLRNAGHWTPYGWTLHPVGAIADNDVVSCRRGLADVIGIDISRMIIPQQVHGTTIADVTSSDVGRPFTADGIVTSERNLLLCISVADCCGVVIWDVKQQLIAAVHSGWRGTAANIVGQCIAHIVERYHITPSQLHAWLSPCASRQQYTVREDVASFLPDFAHPIGGDEFLLDIPGAITSQLCAAGIEPSHIAASGLCTISDDRFHSYRRDREHSGRMAVFTAIVGSE
ncbi:MAG: polyphenol oxidase family protein [Chlorobi bacterium]|nr:polyphenol oxidase family protein [Chlorobiota bacterium]